MELEQLAAEQGYKLVPVSTPSDIVGNHAKSMRMTAHLMIGALEKGGVPDKKAVAALRMVRAYIDLTLEGKVPDVVSAYGKTQEEVT